jgi:DNA-binding CsgD family transcriptional regulator/tetratricopeptide (TPR) repeat protein
VARERGDASAAATLLRRALDEPPASSQRGDVLIELARAEAIDSDPSAMGHLEEALGVVQAPRVRAEALVDLSRLLHQAGDYGRAAALAQRGRSELRPDDRLQPTLQAVFLGAGLIHPPLHQQASEELATLTCEAAAGRPPNEPALLALIANQLTYSDGDGELAAALACRAFAQDPLVDRSSQGASLGFAGWSLIQVDALAAAAPLLDAAVDAAAQRGAVLAGSIAAHCRAQLHLYRGQLELATLDAEQSLSAYRDGWAESSWSAPTLARAHLERGDLDAAAEAIRVGERGDPQRVEYVLLLEVRAALALARGDAERALADATAAIAQVRQGFGLIPMRGFDSRRLAALAAHRLGRAEEAGAFVDDLLDQLRQVDAPRQHGATLACAGVLAGGNRGLALLHEAVATLERSQSCLVALHARMELGVAQRRAGEAEPARESLSGVLERAEEIGAAPMVDRARSELWALGLRPRRAARTGIGSLTPSEQRIAELAAKGLTTPQIAHELYVTRKTVESHLSHIYRKLEIRGRAELPRDLPGADDDAAEITGVGLTATG